MTELSSVLQDTINDLIDEFGAVATLYAVAISVETSEEYQKQLDGEAPMSMLGDEDEEGTNLLDLVDGVYMVLGEMSPEGEDEDDDEDAADEEIFRELDFVD